MTNGEGKPAMDTAKMLGEFLDAWNAHDLEQLMTFMTDDCVYRSSIGSESSGTEYRGLSEVRRGYAAIFEAFPDAEWAHGQHWVVDERGFSEWLFIGTSSPHGRVEVRGCDLFWLRASRIKVKDSFRKQMPASGT